MLTYAVINISVAIVMWALRYDKKLIFLKRLIIPLP